MDTNQYFAEHPLSAGTRRQYDDILQKFAAALDPADCSAIDVLDWLHSQSWGNSRQYVALTAIKGYLRWAYGETHPVLRVKIKREPSPPGRVIKPDQITRLMQLHDTSTRKGKRDLATLCLALDTGLRVGELASLKAAKVDLINRELWVKIKGGTWEIAVFSEYTASVMATWAANRCTGDDRFFQVTRDGLRVIVRRWGEKLGFRLSPHDFRRTFTVLSLRAGAPSRLVQTAGRWSSIQMVEHYSQAITAADFEPYFPVNRIIDS